jgi:hypothetical protein
MGVNNINSTIFLERELGTLEAAHINSKGNFEGLKNKDT